MQRFFLYTYNKFQNYSISKRGGVFGTRKDATGLETKVKKLHAGDIILIRDGTVKSSIEFFGYCIVCGTVFDHDSWSPFRDLLWHDEIVDGKVIYPVRVAVNFEDVPRLCLDRITWGSLDELRFSNLRRSPLRGRQAWAMKFKGNFIENPDEVDAFSRLIGWTRSDITQHGSVSSHTDNGAPSRLM